MNLTQHVGQCGIARKHFFGLIIAALAVSVWQLPSAAHAGLLYNPVVTVVGNGTTTASGVGVTTSISLYGNSVASQAAPISSASYNSGATGTRLVNSLTATSEGLLSNNPGVSDAAAQGITYAGAAYAYSAGYDGANATTGIVAAATGRSVGDVTVTATTVSNATVLKTQTNAAAYTGNNVRSATGDNGGAGAALYAGGTGSPGASGGWRNFNTNSILTASPNNVRDVELLGGNLFGTTGNGSTVGIYLIDPTGATAATPFITTGTSSTASPFEFALFNDPTNRQSIQGYNVAYIADDGSAAAAAGGIEKWTYNGTTWTEAYKLQDTSSTFYRGLAGQLDPTTGKVTLFASTADGKSLQQVTDNGATSPFTTLATVNGTTFDFRGVALAPVPEPSAIVLAGVAVGALCCGRLFRRKR